VKKKSSGKEQGFIPSNQRTWTGEQESVRGPKLGGEVMEIKDASAGKKGGLGAVGLGTTTKTGVGNDERDWGKRGRNTED